MVCVPDSLWGVGGCIVRAVVWGAGRRVGFVGGSVQVLCCAPESRRLAFQASGADARLLVNGRVFGVGGEIPPPLARAQLVVISDYSRPHR